MISIVKTTEQKVKNVSYKIFLPMKINKLLLFKIKPWFYYSTLIKTNLSGKLRLWRLYYLHKKRKQEILERIQN